MARSSLIIAAAALAFGIGAPASAQTGGWWSPVVLQTTNGGGGSILEDAVLGRSGERDRREREESRSPGGILSGNSSAKNGNGRPFCRNGQGHPVHGRRWCEEKARVGNGAWARAGWGDVIFGRGTPQRERQVTQPTIGSILGDVILGRLTRFGREAGLSGSVDGRWLPLSSGGAVMQLRMGGVPLAELADLNRDGRAEVVLLNHVR